jgi:hypothetical protein
MTALCFSAFLVFNPTVSPTHYPHIQSLSPSFPLVLLHPFPQSPDPSPMPAMCLSAIVEFVHSEGCFDQKDAIRILTELSGDEGRDRC